jgi:hypothetical protein
MGLRWIRLARMQAVASMIAIAVYASVSASVYSMHLRHDRGAAGHCRGACATVMPNVVGRGVNSTTTAKRFPFLVYHRSRQLPQHPRIRQILPSKDHDQGNLSILLLSTRMRPLV